MTALIVLYGAIVFQPQLLAFPYHQSISGIDVYSDRPIAANMGAVLASADGRLRTSEIASPRQGGSVFLTDGGWRWHVLATASSGAFAVTRPLSEAVIVNEVDVAADTVRNGKQVGGTRSLSGVMAHEWTHTAIRRHFGILADWRYPAELREGYCDFVAGEGSLTPEDVRGLEQRGEAHPGLLYYHGRKQVEQMLPQLGGSVDRLFQEWDSLT